MKRFLPVSHRGMFILETVTVILFALALYWNLSLYLETKTIENAYAQLKGANIQLDRVSRQIREIDKIKHVLFPHTPENMDYTWENVELEFEPVDFPSLLARLSLLNHEIEEKYKKQGLFVLTSFKTVRKGIEQKGQGTDPKTAEEPVKPGFEIQGKLLCM